MERKIIFFDVDGTLYTPELGGISKNVKNAIRQTRSQGHLCFISSGRPTAFIAENVKEIEFDGYVLANGAHIQFGNKDLRISYLNYDNLKELIEKLKIKGIEYVLQTPTYAYIDRKCINLISFFSKCNIDLCNFCYEFNEDDIMHQTLKIEVWVHNDEELKYAQTCFGNFAYEVHPDNHSIEVYAKDVSKATGILDVLNLLDMSVQDSICFGNGSNDVEMFETVGYSIAMGNAIDVIKDRADEICLSVLQDGVACKLKELFDLK